jgi:hypothetical protein
VIYLYVSAIGRALRGLLFVIIERFLSFFFSRRTNEEDLVADEQKVWYVPPLYEYYGLFFPF